MRGRPYSGHGGESIILHQQSHRSRISVARDVSLESSMQRTLAGFVFRVYVTTFPFSFLRRKLLMKHHLDAAFTYFCKSEQ